ncbi:MAG: enoyl-CoA hydratase-related protein, partial [Pseudomonadota bacterium]
SYTGRKFKPDEALRLGFVNRVLPDHEAANSAAQEMAQEIAAKAPMAIHGIKEIIKFSRDHSTEDALDRIALWNASNLQPSELMAAMGAKQTGEPGQFTALPQRRKVDNRD